jgi:hypothetical protein
MFNFLFIPVSIIPAIISICPFFSLPKKRTKKTLGKNQPTTPQIQPFPRDFAGPARRSAEDICQ